MMNNSWCKVKQFRREEMAMTSSPHPFFPDLSLLAVNHDKVI